MVTTKKRVSTNGEAIQEPVAVPSKAERIVIPKPDFRTFRVTLRGTTSYIMHKFSEKAAQKIKDKQGQKAKEARGKRDPHAEFLAAAYVIKGEAGEKNAVYGIPCRQIKAALVGACRFIDGIPMTFARGVCTILGEGEPNFAVLAFSEMRMNEDAIRLPNKALDLRYRPEFIDWSTTIFIEHLASAVSAEQVINLLAIAGKCCGIGELRPNSTSGPGGTNGMFEVETAPE